MKKERSFRIMNFTDKKEIVELSAAIEKKYGVIQLKTPQKMLVMIKVRESAKNSLFYAGEALACECLVKVGETKGFAAGLGDDTEKVRAMAVIDAVLNSNLPEYSSISETLVKWENALSARRANEAGITMSTKVDFNIMEE